MAAETNDKKLNMQQLVTFSCMICFLDALSKNNHNSFNQNRNIMQIL